MVWPGAMLVNFWYIPILYQVPFIMFLEFVSNIVLSYITYDEDSSDRILESILPKSLKNRKV